MRAPERRPSERALRPGLRVGPARVRSDAPPEQAGGCGETAAARPPSVPSGRPRVRAERYARADGEESAPARGRRALRELTGETAPPPLPPPVRLQARILGAGQGRRCEGAAPAGQRPAQVGTGTRARRPLLAAATRSRRPLATRGARRQRARSDSSFEACSRAARHGQQRSHTLLSCM
jgi:hypothetical protein